MDNMLRKIVALREAGIIMQIVFYERLHSMMKNYECEVNQKGVRL